MIIFNKKFNYNTIFSPELASCLLLFYAPLGTTIIWIIQGIFGRYISLITQFLLTIALLVLAISFVRERNRVKNDMILIPLIIIFLYMCSMLNYGTSYQISRQGLLSETFIGAMPIFLAIRLSRDFNKLWTYIKPFSLLTLALSIIAFFCVDVGSKAYYRSFSNILFVVASFFIVEWLYNEKKLYIIFSIISTFFILTCGRRSSLVSLILLVILICIIKRKYKLIVTIICTILLIYFLWEPIISLLLNFFSNYGVRPRILVRLLAGNVTDDSHRFEQWAYVIELVISDPKRFLMGLGIAGERDYLLNHFSHMVLQGYPHGIHVEMIGHFGVLIGLTIDVLLFIIYPLKIYNKFYLKKEIITIFLFSFTLFSSLLFQDSYIQSRWFFLYLGILMTCITYHRKKWKTVHKYLEVV